MTFLSEREFLSCRLVCRSLHKISKDAFTYWHQWLLHKGVKRGKEVHIVTYCIQLNETGECENPHHLQLLFKPKIYPSVPYYTQVMAQIARRKKRLLGNRAVTLQKRKDTIEREFEEVRTQLHAVVHDCDIATQMCEQHRSKRKKSVYEMNF